MRRIGIMKLIKLLLEKYKLELDEEEIRNTGKAAWKNNVHKQVCSFVVEEMNLICSQGKMTKMFPCQDKIKMKDYMKKMTPSDARLLFSMRSKTLDIRGVRTYMYDEKTCRLCNQETEDIDHALNRCSHVTRNGSIFSEDELYDDDLPRLKEMVVRMKQFITKIKEIESSD